MNHTDARAAPAGGGRGARLLRGLARREPGVLGLWVLTAAVVGVAKPDFLAPSSLHDLLAEWAPAAIVACGVTLVIVTGEIDISVGSLMGLLAAVGAVVTSPDRLGMSPAAGVTAVLALGTAVGLLTGLLVTLGRVPSIIVTLGMLAALRGAAGVVMAAPWIENVPAAMRVWSVGALLGVRVCLWIAAGVIVFTILLARRTPLGRRIHAVGRGSRAAAPAGLGVRRIKVFVFAYTGFLTALATLAGPMRAGTIKPDIGEGFELAVVACVVVGGTSIRGGVGTIFGSILGVLLLGTIGTALVFLRLGPAARHWERAIQGTFILLAVLADPLTRRLPAGRHGRARREARP